MVAFLREQGIRLVIYLDDILILNASYSALLDDYRTVVSLLTSLGFIINYKKSVTIPQQSSDYLGVVIDSNHLSFSLPSAKVGFIIDLCNATLTSNTVTLGNLAKIMRNFSWQFRRYPLLKVTFGNFRNFIFPIPTVI